MFLGPELGSQPWHCPKELPSQQHGQTLQRCPAWMGHKQDDAARPSTTQPQPLSSLEPGDEPWASLPAENGGQTLPKPELPPSLRAQLRSLKIPRRGFFSPLPGCRVKNRKRGYSCPPSNRRNYVLAAKNRCGADSAADNPGISGEIPRNMGYTDTLRR